MITLKDSLPEEPTGDAVIIVDNQEIPAEYHKDRDTGDVTVSTDDDIDDLLDKSMDLVLLDHDGSKESHYVGKFDKNGHFIN